MLNGTPAPQTAQQNLATPCGVSISGSRDGQQCPPDLEQGSKRHCMQSAASVVHPDTIHPTAPSAGNTQHLGSQHPDSVGAVASAGVKSGSVVTITAPAAGDDDGDDHHEDPQVFEAALAALMPRGPVLPHALTRVLGESCKSSSPTAQLQPSASQLLVLAVHAAMLESGFAPQDMNQAQQPAAGGTVTLRYHLPPVDGRPRSGSAAQGSTATTAPPLTCVVVKCVELGGHLVVSATVLGNNTNDTTHNGIKTLTLPVKTYIQTSDKAAAAATATSSAAPSAMDVDEQSGSAEASTSVSAVTPSQDEVNLRLLASLAGSYISLPALWLLLKDGLVLPLLISASRQAGWPLPAGLLTLPSEIQLMCLKALQVNVMLRRLYGCCNVLMGGAGHKLSVISILL